MRQALLLAAVALALAACATGQDRGAAGGAEPLAMGPVPPRPPASYEVGRLGERVGGAPTTVEAHVPEAAHEIAVLDKAIRDYAADRAGRLPSALADLAREKTPDGERYLRSVPADPWGRPYSYAVLVPRAGAFDLRSYGPDGLPGTGDDVVSKGARVRIE